MAMTRSRLAQLLLLTSVALLTTVGVADAQEQLRFVFTPQVWLANIPHNGFAASSSAGAPAGGVFGPPGVNGGPTSCSILFGGTGTFCNVDDLQRSSTDPTSVLFPQWGGQFAVQYGRWTFGLGLQYISFEHSTDLFIGEPGLLVQFKPVGASPQFLSRLDSCATLAVAPAGGQSLPCGTKLGTEVIKTNRIDIDLTASYFFPDVVKDVMDVSAGVGFKWVRSSGHRTFNNNGACDPHGLNIGCPPLSYILKGHDYGNPFPGFFPGDNQLPTLASKASFLDNIYALTLPTTLNFHLGQSGKWLLPFTATPLIGWQERTDQVFGYDSSIAYGGSLDAGVRYVFDNGVAVYAGYRGQAIIGINRQVAHGPLFNMSVAFGGK